MAFRLCGNLKYDHAIGVRVRQLDQHDVSHTALRERESYEGCRYLGSCVFFQKVEDTLALLRVR